MKYSALFQSSKGREMGRELQQLSISCLLSFLFPLFASPLLQKMGADGLKKSRMASTCIGEFSQRKYNQPGQTACQASGIRKSAASTGLISLCLLLAAVDWCRMANLSFCNNFQIRKPCQKEEGIFNVISSLSRTHIAANLCRKRVRQVQSKLLIQCQMKGSDWNV